MRRTEKRGRASKKVFTFPLPSFPLDRARAAFRSSFVCAPFGARYEEFEIRQRSEVGKEEEKSKRGGEKGRMGCRRRAALFF